MAAKKLWLAILSLILILVISGCTKPYALIQDLDKPLVTPPTCYIGAIIDELPADVKIEDKPPKEDIAKFKNYLVKELADKDFFRIVVPKESKNLAYKLSGAIIDYKRGSGFLRFMFGFLGSSRVTIFLELTDTETNEVVFSGNFTRGVTHYAEQGSQMFEQISKDFAKALRKRMTKLTGQKY